jgi:Ring finger domain
MDMSSPWRHAINEGYHRFSDKSQDTALWDRLVITAAPADREECCICFDRLSASEQPSHCGHTFHAGCLSDWRALSDTCPVCRAQLSGSHQHAAVRSSAPLSGILRSSSRYN